MLRPCNENLMATKPGGKKPPLGFFSELFSETLLTVDCRPL